ncbi:similar to Saccharomyces cerevisiae YNL073W MSK1 Mitochondrial lysine-tRNA synthetase [Maudiozyma saulgeensis]|uniref:lysine--tRNA ligase n=1 Tax=Maudiozyma saulgeensis TaxID=1789683 RepID=A0A1X7QYY0_9SACH|nr:similar to Saccharomyces cerevisiae YNL073W MSK1 Mitochondrial lysine-tRNA synthetase [Kazachstania saulgeensis]
MLLVSRRCNVWNRLKVSRRLILNCKFHNNVVVNQHINNSNILKINTKKLQTQERVTIIENDLNKYYPSMSLLNNSLKEINSITNYTIEQFIDTYVNNKLDHDESDILLKINGRIKNVRIAGKKMCFIDLIDTQTNKSLQIIINFNKLNMDCNDTNKKISSNEFIETISFLKKNDYIQVIGNPGVSENIQRTVSLKCIRLPIILSPIQVSLPNALQDNVKINKNRVLDYQVNGITTIMKRSQLINLIRKFLLTKQFIEVETPILSEKANGASALPFITKLNFSDSNLQLRIAPELWLKRLIIGGFDKIFEIGKVFRNESVDATHNPEFTMLELYQRYLSMDQLILLAQDMFKFVLKGMINPEISLSHNNNETIYQLYQQLQDNDWKFKKIEFLPTLSKEMGVDFNKIDLSRTQPLMDIIPFEVKQEIFNSIELQEPDLHLSPQRILDKLCGKYIESRYCQTLLPTIIMHHPTVMSPLAKINSLDNKVSQRFEVFINGKEYINAYEEENCPQLQLQKFKQQHDFKNNDKESLEVDYEYVEAMKSGMPPTGGLGLGIDRLCMLLLDKSRIEQVLSFGSLDDVNIQ